MDQGFGKEKGNGNGNGNGKGKWSNGPQQLDHLTYPFTFLFSHQIFDPNPA